MPASQAPVFVGPQQQAQQQQQQQMYHQHLAAQQAMRMQPQQAQQVHNKPYHHQFMAAALAGNYGPAQQMAAALHAAQQQQRHPQQQQMHMPPHHQMHQQHHQQQQPQQQQSVHMQHQQQLHMPQHHQMQQHSYAPPGSRPMSNIVAQAIAPASAVEQVPQAQAQAMAVQESSLRNNIVPAPAQFSASIDSNSIEMNDAPKEQQQTGLTVAGSAQHPVIAQATGQGSVLHESNNQQSANNWPLQAPDIPKIVSLEVKCEKNLMKVSIEFDKIFNGVIFSKGHYNQGQCLHVSSNSAKQQAYFDISINSCGTQGNTQNGLYGMGGNTGSGTYFENTIVIQYDPNVQEVYDHARKLRCTWHDQYEKAVTFRPFPVDMLDIVRADFAGDNVGCWMQIQVGRGK